jgi:hypothetical protein
VAHTFSAGHQHAQLSATLELQKHLHGHSRAARHYSQGGIALIKPVKGAGMTWIQLIDYLAQFPITRHSRQDRFQAGQGLRCKAA